MIALAVSTRVQRVIVELEDAGNRPDSPVNAVIGSKSQLFRKIAFEVIERYHWMV